METEEENRERFPLTAQMTFAVVFDAMEFDALEFDEFDALDFDAVKLKHLSCNIALQQNEMDTVEKVCHCQYDNDYRKDRPTLRLWFGASPKYHRSVANESYDNHDPQKYVKRNRFKNSHPEIMAKVSSLNSISNYLVIS